MSLCTPLQIPAIDDHATRRKILTFLSHSQEALWNSFIGTSIERPYSRPLSLNLQMRQGSSLGDLQILPIELLGIVFQFSHLQSLFHFLRLNSVAYNVVKNSLVFSTLTKHASTALLVLSQTGASSYFTASQVLDALSRWDCALRGKSAFLLYLPECMRCCFPCFRKSELDLMPVGEAVAAFGLTNKSVAPIPVVSMTVVSRTTLMYKRTPKLVSARLAREVALAQHGGEDLLAAYVKSPGPKRKQDYYDKMARWAADGTLAKRQYKFRSWAMIPVPYVERSRGVAHSGVWCRGCCGDLYATNYKEAYTEEDFFEHVVHECVGAWDLWKTRRESGVLGTWEKIMASLL